jgi:biotin carboxylase
MPTILCIATYLKGEAFLRECRRQGCTVLLLTANTLTSAEWPREAIDEMHTVPRDATTADVFRRVDAIARTRRIDRVAALDDFDVETAAAVREHLQLSGLGRTAASHYRDKLAMRTMARAIGLAVPEFTPVFTDSEVAAWTDRVAAPWVLKPRSSAAAIGIKKIADQAELWRALDAAGDRRSQCLLEAFVAGEVYHVDSIVWRGKVVFAVAFKYGRPPMEIAHQGGIFVTRRLRDDSAEGAALLAANRWLQGGLGMQCGVSHTEFIGRAVSASEGARETPRRRPKRSGAKPDVVFLETSARVGGAFIADTVETATGINLWHEWARIEIAGEDGEYAVPAHRDEYAGIVLSLARQPDPDTSPYVDPEIVTRIRKHHHAGLIVGSPDPARIEALLADYTERFVRDFYATAPPPERPVE